MEDIKARIFFLWIETGNVLLEACGKDLSLETRLLFV